MGLLCERCGKKPATVHYTEITNNKKQELHLCEECAREAGITGFGGMPQFIFQDFLGGLFEPEPEAPMVVGRRCPRCGLKEEDFLRRGILGCAECYSEFRGTVEQVLHRIHGTVQHTGKVPARSGKISGVKQELARLRRELEMAVRKEEFEKAAKLRDRIRELEKTLGGGK